jgi:SAM-dependent methyltransferase
MQKHFPSTTDHDSPAPYEEGKRSMRHIRARYFPDSTFVGPYETNRIAAGIWQEQWLWQCREFIKGTVLDMSTPRYWHEFLYGLETVDRVLVSDLDQKEVSKLGHSSPVDVLGDFSAFPPPLPPASVDTVLCLSILEHCSDPGALMKNLAAILRPGGVAFVLAPFAYIDGHLRPDYWRFGRDGLRLLAKNAGLERIREGYFGDFGKYLIEELDTDASATDWHRGVPYLTWIICKRPEASSSADTVAPLDWETVRNAQPIRLYAGDLPAGKGEYDGWTGLSLTKADARHLRHDVTEPFPLPDGAVDAFQAEDVFEHIEYLRLVSVLNEIYRVLKPGGYFRLSVPDYRCDVLLERSEKDADGDIAFDPGGGGSREKPGHVWFPRLESVRDLLERSEFGTNGSIEFLHYYREDGSPVCSPVDYSKGFIQRTPDHDDRVRTPYRPMSLVVDLGKPVTAGPAADSLAWTELVTPADIVVQFGAGDDSLLRDRARIRAIRIEPDGVARETVPANGIEVVGTPEAVGPGLADLIVSEEALQHVLSPYETLCALLRVLKPGGQAVFVTSRGDNGGLYCWNEQTLGNLFQRAGFRVDRLLSARQQVAIVAHKAN